MTPTRSNWPAGDGVSLPRNSSQRQVCLTKLRGARLPVELPDDFARISWAELTGYMREAALRDSDQMSMAVSLELRVPFSTIAWLMLA